MSSSPRNRGSGVRSRSRSGLGVRVGVTRPMRVLRSGVGGAGAELEKMGLGLEGIGKGNEVEMGVAEVGIGVVEVGVGAMVVEEGLGGREDSERLLTLRLDVLLCKLRPTIFFVIFNAGKFLSVSDSSEAVSYMILSFDMSLI